MVLLEGGRKEGWKKGKEEGRKEGGRKGGRKRMRKGGGKEEGLIRNIEGEYPITKHNR